MTRLNARDGKYLYRLPTEAEWEYACKAGIKDDRVGARGVCGAVQDEIRKQSQPVGQKAPNARGLHYMHGNAAEWVQDWYAHDYYENSQRVDPAGRNRDLIACSGALAVDAAELLPPSLVSFRRACVGKVSRQML